MRHKFQVRKAIRRQTKLKMGIAGPSGSGKTYTTLEIASALGKRVLLADTEYESSELYADRFDFDIAPITDYHPDTVGDVIKYAESEGYDVVIFDSLTHIYNGAGGLLELANNFGKRYKGNTYAGWRDASPIWDQMIADIKAAKIHVLCTMRSKTAYLQTENSKGKTQIEKAGMEPVIRDGFEYELDIVLDMDYNNVATVSKTRMEALTGRTIRKPGADFGRELKEWADNGDSAPSPTLEERCHPTAQSEPVAEPEPVKTWADLPKNRQQSIAIRRKELADSIEWGPKYSGYDEWIESAGILGLKPDGKPSFAVSTVDQINRAMAFLEKLAVDRPKQPEPPKDSLPVSEATRQAATANGVIDPTKFDPPNPRDVLTKTMAAVKGKDIRLHSVLADARPSITGGRLQLSFPDGYDWHYQTAVGGISTLCECADMPVDLHLDEPEQVSA